MTLTTSEYMKLVHAEHRAEEGLSRRATDRLNSVNLLRGNVSMDDWRKARDAAYAANAAEWLCHKKVFDARYAALDNDASSNGELF
jgi:hypothetical protein